MCVCVDRFPAQSHRNSFDGMQRTKYYPTIRVKSLSSILWKPKQLLCEMPRIHF